MTIKTDVETLKAELVALKRDYGRLQSEMSQVRARLGMAAFDEIAHQIDLRGQQQSQQIKQGKFYG